MLQSMGVTRVKHNLATEHTHMHTHTHTHTHAPMFTAALISAVKRCKQAACLQPYR